MRFRRGAVAPERPSPAIPTARYVLAVLGKIARELDPRRVEVANRWAFWVWTALAVVLLEEACLLLVFRFPQTGRLALILTVVRVLPLPWASSRPVGVWWFSTIATTVNSALIVTETWPWPGGSALVTLAVLGVIGQVVTAPTAVVVWLLTNSSGLILVVCYPERVVTEGVLFAAAALSAVVLVVSQLHRERATALRSLVEAERDSALERDRRSRLEERARIARELHDVVAHHMSVIAVQAGSAPMRIGVDEQARREFDSLAQSARSSLSEMRHLLSVLRGEDNEAEPDCDRSGKGIGELSALVENAARAGIPATLEIHAEVAMLRSWSSTAELTIYRIVQEGLSNVIRHAPGSHACVRLSIRAHGLLLEVVNGPANGRSERNPRAERRGGDSHRIAGGLRGISERAAIFGGSVSTTHIDNGGFELSVWLSLPSLLAAPVSR